MTDRIKILYVDDEENYLRSFSRAMMEESHLEIETALDGEIALEKLKTFPAHIVITDLCMPHMDGITLLKEIKKHYPHIYVLIITGHGTIESAINTMKMGAFDFILKPFDFDVIKVTIKKIIDRIEAEKVLEKIREQEKEMRRVQSEFISLAAHEMSTPLTPIKNAINLILDGKTGEINEAQEKFLTMAKRNIDRLTNLLNNLLGIVEIKSDQIFANYDKMDIRHCVDQVIEILKPMADAKQISLMPAINTDVPAIYADQDRVKNVMVHLVSNAIKFTHENDIITITANRIGGHPDMPDIERGFVSISVKDNGIGISKEQIDRVFDKFYQAESSLSIHKDPGVGIGLALSKVIAEAHGGNIFCESKEGKGSTFTLVLPITR